MVENKEIKKSGLATAGLVLGIVGICTSFIPIINNISFILGILAVIFGAITIKKAGKGKVIATIVLGVLSIVITLSAQKAATEALDEVSKNLDNLSGVSTEEILANDVSVDLGNFEVVKGEYSNDTKLTVKVTNKTNTTKSFSIQIEAIDKTGARINQDYVYANNLNAGQSQDFDIFTFITSDKLEEMKNATFKIVEVSMS